jgi:HEPN domain-containing protein
MREARSGSTPPRLTCSLSQQSAEKSLKAALIALDFEPPRIHDLTTLLGQIPGDWYVRELSADLAELTSWAVEARYPADMPEATLSQAEIAVVQAEHVLERVTSDITSRGLAADQRA